MKRRDFLKGVAAVPVVGLSEEPKKWEHKEYGVGFSVEGIKTREDLIKTMARLGFRNPERYVK